MTAPDHKPRAYIYEWAPMKLEQWAVSISLKDPRVGLRVRRYRDVEPLYDTAAIAAAEARGLRMSVVYHENEIARLNEVIDSNDEYAARTGRNVSEANVICYNKRAAHEAHVRAILALIPAAPAGDK